MNKKSPDFGSREAGILGGIARAKAMSIEEKKAVARKAAEARWGIEVPEASHEGEFNLGSVSVSAAVLPNGKRLLTQATFLRALGRSRSPKAGTGVLSTVEGLPFFLQAQVLEPFITDELRASTTPIFFRDKGGKRSVGYDAELLPAVAEVYLKFRDALNTEGKPLPPQYARIVLACDLIMRGLARVGIVALVDEATGYQNDRARDALARILEAFVAKEIQKWIKTFQIDYYRELFRLWQIPFDPNKPSVKKPSFVGKLTNNFVYARLAPGVLSELRRKNPVTESGRRAAKHHQFLTRDIGHPKLSEHLAAVTALMKASPDKDTFRQLIDRALPKYFDMPLFDKPADETTAEG